MIFRKDIRLMAFVMAAMFWGSGAYAVDNSIYIDQDGNGATIYIEQAGTSNTVRGIAGQGVTNSNDNPAKIYGAGNNVDIRQIGSSNTLDFGISTTGGTQSTQNTFVYNVTGTGNTAIIQSNNADQAGASAGNNINFTSTANNTEANINVLGTDNNLTIANTGNNNSYAVRQNGSTNVANITTSGAYNTIVSKQGDMTAVSPTTNDNGKIDLTVSGASNSINISQTGGTSNGHLATLDVQGSSNTISVTQSGAVDNLANVLVKGSNSGGNSGSITIIQRQ